MMEEKEISALKDRLCTAFIIPGGKISEVTLDRDSSGYLLFFTPRRGYQFRTEDMQPLASGLDGARYCKHGIMDIAEEDLTVLVDKLCANPQLVLGDPSPPKDRGGWHRILLSPQGLGR